MSLTLSDDLRQALEIEGMPLKLIDPATGETYVVVLESAFAAACGNAANVDQELLNAQIPNARLQELAKQHSPPQDWHESEEDDLFE